MVFPFLLALLLGFKHSYDADHILAVSTLISRTRSLKNVIKMSISWSIGHMLTASIITLILFHFRNYFITYLLGYFTYAVAAMLIVLGIFAIVNVKFIHLHKHHNRKEHVHDISNENSHHKRMFGIGVVQGLASNDEMITLFIVSLTLVTLPQILIGVALFSLGVVLSMLLYSVGLNYSMKRFGNEKMIKTLQILTGISSIGYGALMFLGVV